MPNPQTEILYTLLIEVMNGKASEFLSLKPVDQAIEKYLLRRMILKRRGHLQEKGRIHEMDMQMRQSG